LQRPVAGVPAVIVKYELAGQLQAKAAAEVSSKETPVT
jgi:hypothetical protein